MTNVVLVMSSEVKVDLPTHVSVLHVSTKSFICVISVLACLIHSPTTAPSAWCIDFLDPRVSRCLWSSPRLGAGSLLYIVYTSEYGSNLLPAPSWVNCTLMMSRSARSVWQLTL